MRAMTWTALFVCASVAACSNAGEDTDTAIGEAKGTSSCAEITKALNLPKSSDGALGFAGALNVEDTATKEVVRIFVSETRHVLREGMEIQDFTIGAVMPIQGGEGKLFTALDTRTNVQLLDLENITKGCELGFNGRQLGPSAVMVRKEVASTAPNTVVLKPSLPDRDLPGELKITFHGKNMD
jgi:hypothetical protein